jgi:hypothetical protein
MCFRTSLFFIKKMSCPQEEFRDLASALNTKHVSDNLRKFGITIPSHVYFSFKLCYPAQSNIASKIYHKCLTS